MTKYQELISKIQKLKTDKLYSNSDFLTKFNWNFSPAELELITDALETMQFLEIVLKTRKEKSWTSNT